MFYQELNTTWIHLLLVLGGTLMKIQVEFSIRDLVALIEAHWDLFVGFEPFTSRTMTQVRNYLSRLMAKNQDIRREERIYFLSGSKRGNWKIIQFPTYFNLEDPFFSDLQVLRNKYGSSENIPNTKRPFEKEDPQNNSSFEKEDPQKNSSIEKEDPQNNSPPKRLKLFGMEIIIN